MNWGDERYVRLYTRDTPDWILWPWQSRALFPLLTRKCDRGGVICLGQYGRKGLAALVMLPLEIVETGLDGLVADGCIILDEQNLVIKNFMEAQEAVASDRARARTFRARHRATALGSITLRDEVSREGLPIREIKQAPARAHLDKVTQRDAPVTLRDAPVTQRDETSREITRVTPSRSELNLAKPNQTELISDAHARDDASSTTNGLIGSISSIPEQATPFSKQTPATPASQPVKKGNNKPRPAVAPPPPPDDAPYDFERIFDCYPKCDGRTEAIAICEREIKTDEDYDALERAVKCCAKEKLGVEAKHIKSAKNFMSVWQDYATKQDANDRDGLEGIDVDLRRYGHVEIPPPRITGPPIPCPPELKAKIAEAMARVKTA